MRWTGCGNAVWDEFGMKRAGRDKATCDKATRRSCAQCGGAQSNTCTHVRARTHATHVCTVVHKPGCLLCAHLWCGPGECTPQEVHDALGASTLAAVVCRHP